MSSERKSSESHAAAASSKERRKQRRKAARTQTTTASLQQRLQPESPSFLCDEDNYMPDDADLSLLPAAPVAARRPPVTIPCGTITPSLMLKNFQHFVHKLGILELTKSQSPYTRQLFVNCSLNSNT